MLHRRHLNAGPRGRHGSEGFLILSIRLTIRRQNDRLAPPYSRRR
jgi:hypothetical protein